MITMIAIKTGSIQIDIEFKNRKKNVHKGWFVFKFRKCQRKMWFLLINSLRMAATYCYETRTARQFRSYHWIIRMSCVCLDLCMNYWHAPFELAVMLANWKVLSEIMSIFHRENGTKCGQFCDPFPFMSAILNVELPIDNYLNSVALKR